MGPDQNQTQPTAPAGKPVRKRWYIVNTYTGSENVARASLIERIKANALDEFFGDVLVPTEKVAEVRAGVRRETKRKFFPGYILVQMALNQETWHLVKGTQKIIGFVGGGTNPPSVPEEEVRKITAQLEQTEVSAKLIRRGLRIIEVPIEYRARSFVDGKKITWRDGVVALWVLLKYRFTE